MQPENDDRPVTHAYLREVLVKVDESLQEFSRAINKLQQPQGSTVDTNRVIEIEKQVERLHQKIQEAVRDDKGDDQSQNILQQQIQKIETRLNQLERIEKTEEYEQNTIVNDVRQLQRDFEVFEKRFRDAEYKLRKL